MILIVNFENEATTHNLLFYTLFVVENVSKVKVCPDDLLTQFEVSIKTKRPVVLDPFPAVECVKKVTTCRAAGGDEKYYENLMIPLALIII